MYSGTTFARHSGGLVGVHQRIDRVAYRHLKKMNVHAAFPRIKDIIHFEGNNGPDGIKRKSPSKDEPWHFIDPLSAKDQPLIRLIRDHLTNLTQSLIDKNESRAAFESAWLAHAVVDGLTPAHHYPLGDKIEELWGKPHHERSTVKDKNVIKGTNRRDTISKNWQYWGGGGIFSQHILFESGVATSILFQKFDSVDITRQDFKNLEKYGFEKIFLDALHEIADLQMYEEFGKKGWTRHLGNESRKILVPKIIKTVCLAWYDAIMKAETKSV